MKWLQIKNIIENEFYLCIWENASENVEEKLEKRAINWKNRLKQCDLESEILEKTEIILLIKKFYNSRICSKGECGL